MDSNSNWDANKQAEAGQSRKKETRLPCSCERLSVSDTISAKIRGGGRTGMGKVSALPIIQAAAQNRRLTRREMVQRLLASAGAGAAWPLVAGSHPIHALLANGAVPSRAASAVCFGPPPG